MYEFQQPIMYGFLNPVKCGRVPWLLPGYTILYCIMCRKTVPVAVCAKSICCKERRIGNLYLDHLKIKSIRNADLSYLRKLWIDLRTLKW